MFAKIAAWFVAVLISMAFAGSAAAGPAYDAARTALEAKDLASMAAAVAAADPDDLHGDRTPLLSLAAWKGNLQAVDWLLSHGADPDVKAAALYGGTPLMLAAGNNDLPMMQRLLKAGAAVDARDAAGDTALNWAAYYGFTNVAELLLRSGTDSRIRGHGNAAEIAIRRGHQPFLIAVLEAEHRLHAVRGPAIALQAAIKADDAAAVIRAIRAGADANGLDRTNRPWLSQAARLGKTAAVSALLRAGAQPDKADEIGFTPLMEAAREGKAGVVRQLIEAGADVNRRSGDHALGLAPLHLAAIGGDRASIDLLLRHGARIDALDTSKATAMLWALYENKADAAALLVQRGGNPDLANDQGDSPRIFAHANEITALLAVLTEP